MTAGVAAKPGDDHGTTITRRLVAIADTAEIFAVSSRAIRRDIAKAQFVGVRLGHTTLPAEVESAERFIVPLVGRERA